MKWWLNWWRAKRHMLDRSAAHSAERVDGRAPTAKQAFVPQPAFTSAHDPALVAKLKQEHRALLDHYGSIKQLARAAQWHEVELQVVSMRIQLADHLLTESVLLYTHLKQALHCEPMPLHLVDNFSVEMDGIGSFVMEFLQAHTKVASDPMKQDKFLFMWETIGNALGARIAREERTLYPLYDATKKVAIS